MQSKETEHDWKWLSSSIFDPSTNTTLYNKFELNNQHIMCFDVVLVQREENQVGIGRIMKIYQTGDGLNDDTPYISLKWYEQPSSNGSELIFNAYDNSNIAINNIKSKVIVLDSQQLMNECCDRLPVFYCEQYYALDKGTVSNVTDDAYNARYWDQQKQSELQKFEAYTYERRHSLNTINTSSTASMLDQSQPLNVDQNENENINDGNEIENQNENENQNQNQNTHSQLQFVSSPTLSDSDESNDNCTNMVRHSQSTFNRNINPRKRLLSQLSQLQMDAPPSKRRKTQVSSSYSLLSSSLSSSSSSCKSYVSLLKTEIKLLTKSLSDKDSVIHQTNSLFEHFDKLVHQKDSVIDQKNEIIQQKNEMLDTYKFIVTSDPCDPV